MRNVVIKTKRIRHPKGRNRLVSVLFIFAILIPVVASAEFPSNQQPYPPDLYSQCFDGIDNDGDGTIDLKDSDCPKCFDGVDNDGDKDIDLADSDCPKAKRSFLSAAAAAFLGSNNGQIGGGNIPIGENIGGGNIPIGENIAISKTTCSGRISVFPRRVRTESGFFYVVQHTTCINLIPVVDNDDDDVFINTSRRRIPIGANIPIGENIGSGSIPVGSNIPVGGSIPVSGPIPIGANIPVGGDIGSGSIPVGGNIPVGGSIPIGANIPIGGNIPVGGII